MASRLRRESLEPALDGTGIALDESDVRQFDLTGSDPSRNGGEHTRWEGGRPRRMGDE
jgi:hypothetical protein